MIVNSKVFIWRKKKKNVHGHFFDTGRDRERIQFFSKLFRTLSITDHIYYYVYVSRKLRLRHVVQKVILFKCDGGESRQVGSFWIIYFFRDDFYIINVTIWEPYLPLQNGSPRGTRRVRLLIGSGRPRGALSRPPSGDNRCALKLFTVSKQII